MTKTEKMNTDVSCVWRAVFFSSLFCSALYCQKPPFITSLKPSIQGNNPVAFVFTFSYSACRLIYIYIPNKILLFLVLRLLELWCKQRNAALYSPTMLQILVYYYHHRALFALSALHCSLEILPNKQNRYVANASLVMLFRTVCSLSSAFCSHIRFRPWNQVSKCDRKMWQNMTIIHLCTIKPTTGIFNHDIFIWNIFLRSRQAEYENIKKHMQQLIYWHWKVSLNLLGFNDVMKGGFRPYNKLD